MAIDRGMVGEHVYQSSQQAIVCVLIPLMSSGVGLSRIKAQCSVVVCEVAPRGMSSLICASPRQRFERTHESIYSRVFSFVCLDSLDQLLFSTVLTVA